MKKWIILGIILTMAMGLLGCGAQDEGFPGQARNDEDDVVVAVATPTSTPTPTPTPTPEPEPVEDEFDERLLDDSLWGFARFADIRQPQHLAYYVPHGEIAVRHIEFMNDNLYARSPFTYREKETAIWLVEELLAMGYDWDYIEVQEFYKGDVAQRVWHSWDTPTGQWILGDGVTRYYSQNVILTVPGQSDRKVVVGAHYDTLPYPGASDNASGTALLLESAQRMLYLDNYYTIVYIFFGAEEVGLVGAHVYVDSLTFQERARINFMINADVLFEGPYLMYGAGRFASGQVSENDITRQVSEIALEVSREHDIELLTTPDLLFAGSDHLPFKWAGHTVVVLFGMEMDDSGRWRPQVLHSPQDCFHYINERWPGKIDTNMRYYSIFLEELLMASW